MSLLAVNWSNVGLQAGQLLLALSILVILHEFGHFITARWFKCRVTDDGSGWFLEKTTGSQRLSGRFYTQSDTKLVFVGAGHVNNDPQRKYGQDPQEDQVAIATRLGKSKVVLEFPAPQYESKLDVLLLER